MREPGSNANEPDFMIIGSMKSGTTSLWRYLKDHPQVQMARGKELHFFSHSENWERGWEWYLAQFPERAPTTVAMGEASVSYTRSPEYPDVPERIATRLPRTRFIYLVRHPIERMRSHYIHEVRRGRERKPIDSALLEDPRYFDPSRYAMQIERYLGSFDEQQMLVMTSGYLRDHRAEALSHVFRALGVDEGWDGYAGQREFNRSEDSKGLRPAAARVRANPVLRRLARLAPGRLRRSGYKRIAPDAGVLSPSTRSILEDRLAPDVENLRRFIKGPFDGWGIG